MMTKELFIEICESIETTSVGVCRMCKQFGVSPATFYKFVNANEENKNRYARSKLLQCEYLADELLDIADDGSNDFMTVVKGDEEYEKECKEVVNRSRLRVDTRKWLLSKLVPKKYGDRVEVEHSGKVEIPQEITFKIKGE